MLLRPAQPEDAIAVARVHVRSWQAAYRGLLPDDYLDGLRPEDRAEKYDFTGADPLMPSTLVAVDDGAILGFASTMASRDRDLMGYGELCALYVDPEHWGRGVGVALIEAARERMLERGFRDALLWVLVGNTRAERFYRMDGWDTDEARRTATVWNVTVEEVRYRRSLASP
jgi:GNAT superfamily N-acetyltransferase